MSETVFVSDQSYETISRCRIEYSSLVPPFTVDRLRVMKYALSFIAPFAVSPFMQVERCFDKSFPGEGDVRVLDVANTADEPRLQLA
jgi:hypothetical protein